MALWEGVDSNYEYAMLLFTVSENLEKFTNLSLY